MLPPWVPLDSSGSADTSTASKRPAKQTPPAASKLWHALERALRETLPDARLAPYRLDAPVDLTLGLIEPGYQTGPLAPEVMARVIAQPAYWAFCWGSGLALAQFLLEDPTWVAGRSVLDFGSGSGVAGIAAALGGAKRVTAVDNDEHALLASRCNAAVNGVALTAQDQLAPEQRFDLGLMADVLYDRDNLALLTLISGCCDQLLIADSRLRDLDQLLDQQPQLGLAVRPIAQRSAVTLPNLGEFDEFRDVVLFSRR
ncbi:MAG: 50S ribosomal protein L11 methyltransferase [Pseudomonadota bacterium]